MRRGGPESEPRTQIELTDNQIFQGPDGIAFTDFGSNLHKLASNVQELSKVNGYDGESKKRLEEEVRQSCLETRIPYSMEAIGAAVVQYQQLVDQRMSRMSLRNGNQNAWLTNIKEMVKIQKRMKRRKKNKHNEK